MTATAALKKAPAKPRIHRGDPLITKRLNDLPNTAIELCLRMYEASDQFDDGFTARSLRSLALQKAVDDEKSKLGHYLRDCEYQKLAPDPEVIEGHRQAIDHAKGRLTKFQDESSDANANRLPAERLDNFVRRMQSGTKYIEWEGTVPAKYKGKAGLVLLRKEMKALHEERAACDKAQLPESDGIAALDFEVRSLRASGTPDLRPLLRMLSQDINSNRKTQGKIRWPKHIMGLDGDKDIPNALAVMFWLFGDEIFAKLKAELKRNAKPEGALSLEERKIKLADIDEKILRNWRYQATITNELIADDVNVRHNKDCPMIAILGIEVDSGI